MYPVNKLSDEGLKLLAAEIASGNEESFRKLFDHFTGSLKSFSYSILKSKEAATEVVDDVLVKIWMNRKKLSGIDNLRVYLYTATKNTSLNYLSKKAREMTTEPFDDISILLRDDHCPEKQMITQELFGKIHAAVEDLPPRCKMIFKLVREDGLKYKEVAEILKISINTVDAQMVIAVKKISEAVQGAFSFFPGYSEKKFKKNFLNS